MIERSVTTLKIESDVWIRLRCNHVIDTLRQHLETIDEHINNLIQYVQGKQIYNTEKCRMI